MPIRTHALTTRLLVLCSIIGPSCALAQGVIESAEPPVAADAPAPALQTIDQVVDAIDARGVAGAREVWPQVGLGDALPFGDLGGSDALTVTRGTSDINGDGNDDAVLIIHDADCSECRIVILSAAATDGLNAVGDVVFYNQHKRAPTWRVESGSGDGGGRWFVVESIAGAGSGFNHEIATWYEAEATGLREVLEYSVEGHVSGHDMPFDRTFSSDAPRIAQEDGAAIIDVHVTATYTNGEAFEIDGLGDLFERSGTVRYRLDSETDSFEHDADASAWSEAELAGVFSDDEQGFLQHNVSHLKRLAAEGTDAQQTWVRRLLDRCDASTEKDLVEAALGEGN